MTGVLRTTIERDKEAIEAMQQRLEELGAPRMRRSLTRRRRKRQHCPNPKDAGATASTSCTNLKRVRVQIHITKRSRMRYRKPNGSSMSFRQSGSKPSGPTPDNRSCRG